MTDREAMKQALEALEEINKLSIGENAICLPAEIDDAMDALRERLAQLATQPTVLECLCKDRCLHAGMYQCRGLPSPLAAPLPKQEPVGYWEGEFSDDGGATLYEVPQQSIFGRKYRNAPLYASPPQRKPLPPQSPCEMTQAEGKMFKLGWLECEAAHGIKGEA